MIKMRKVVKLAEAAEYTGLTPWELRQGAKAGRYPHLRSGGAKGTIFFDLELLEDAITRLMMANASPYIREYSGIRPIPFDLATK